MSIGGISNEVVSAGMVTVLSSGVKSSPGVAVPSSVVRYATSSGASSGADRVSVQTTCSGKSRLNGPGSPSSAVPGVRSRVTTGRSPSSLISTTVAVVSWTVALDGSLSVTVRSSSGSGVVSPRISRSIVVPDAPAGIVAVPEAAV